MKKILVPVDFSKLSDNAADYAVQLVEHAKAELILIHVFYIPIVIHDIAMMLPPLSEQREEGLKNLEKMRENILKFNPDVHINYHCIQGIPVEEISAFAEKEMVDVIVIGAQGAGYLEERIFGSTATLLMRTTNVSVMVINSHVKFKKPEHIALAVDYEETDNNSALKALKQLTALFNSHVSVLNVITGPHAPAEDEIEESFLLEHALKYIRHTYYRTQHKEVISGINVFVRQHGIHLLAMIAHKHSLISRILHEPHTKEMAFHTEVPLLVLHEHKP